MAAFTLFPLNDFVKLVKPKDIDSTTGVVTNLITGVVTAFFAVTDLPTATAADPTLSMTPAYIAARGGWLVFFDATVLTPALLATHFAAVPPILIVQYPGGFRVVFEGAYSATRTGTLG